MKKSMIAVASMCVCASVMGLGASKTEFAEFDRRAREGETLRVAFFGASLTWGANATNQELTSYRAQTKALLEEKYPKARFLCFDGAIGGTGSQLGVFRLERDALRHKPDLVFLDFSANDGHEKGRDETFASYESLMRRLVLEAELPVVAVMFPFKWQIEPSMKAGNTKHLEAMHERARMAEAYGIPVADAVWWVTEKVQQGEATIEGLWSTDHAHPGDQGYRYFAEAAFAAYEKAVEEKRVCKAPEKMFYADTYMTLKRARLAEMAQAAGTMPEGWRVGVPNLVAACQDQLMSRWLDAMLVTGGKGAKEGEKAATLKFKVQAKMMLVYGECTMKSGKYRVKVDGKVVPHKVWDKEEELFDMSAVRFGGNWNYGQVIVEGMDESVVHEVEIEPVLEEGQELKIESLCVAGGPATVAWGE